METKLKYKDFLTLAISIIAFLMSGYIFLVNNFFDQHVLKASVVSINKHQDSLSCDILVVNTGRSYETIYSARFIFSNDLNKGGGSLSDEKIGPIIIPPKQAIIATLTTKMLDLEHLEIEGKKLNNEIHLHIGVIFDVIDDKGRLTENSKYYKITRLKFNSSGKSIGAAPMEGDDEGMIDLL